MESTPLAEQQQSLEQFRHLLFHLQMECGSIHDLFRFFKEENSLKHFDALKQIDPNLMPQLLAREYVLEARRASNAEKAKAHLETALQLDPQCPEACMELAYLSQSSEAAMMWYQRSMDACENSLGGSAFNKLLKDFEHHPWKQVELHIWIKAKVNLAETLFRSGFYENAIAHFQALLDLNPKDDLNLRPYLVIALLCTNRLAEAEVASREYGYDGSAAWYYSRAFLRYKIEGGSKRSERVLTRAFKRNLWVAVYLLGLEEMPNFKGAGKKNRMEELGSPETTKQSFREGSRKEAVECVRCVAPAFCEDNKLVCWVWERLKETVE